MAYPATFYEAFNSEVDALTIDADYPAAQVVGIMTRAAKRAQMVVDRELAPIGQRGSVAGVMRQGHIEQAVLTAGTGGTVLIIADRLNEAGEIAAAVEDATPEVLVEKISRASGARSIRFRSGGRIIFLSLRQSARGYVADRVYVPIGTPGDKLAEIIPMIATRKDGQIIDY